MTFLLAWPFRIGLGLIGTVMVAWVAPRMTDYAALVAFTGAAAWIIAGVLTVIRIAMDRDS